MYHIWLLKAQLRKNFHSFIVVMGWGLYLCFLFSFAYVLLTPKGFIYHHIMSLPLARQLATSNKSRLWCITSPQRPLLSAWRRYASSAVATATVDTHSTTTAQQQPSQHLILPNPSLPSFRYNSRVLPSHLAEQFAILNACIRSGDMGRAERIMKELHRTKNKEMKLFADIHLYNAFLNGFAEATMPMGSECLIWVDNMKSFGLSPDVNTYAITIKAYLRQVCVGAGNAMPKKGEQKSPCMLTFSI